MDSLRRPRLLLAGSQNVACHWLAEVVVVGRGTRTIPSLPRDVYFVRYSL